MIYFIFYIIGMIICYFAASYSHKNFELDFWHEWDDDKTDISIIWSIIWPFWLIIFILDFVRGNTIINYYFRGKLKNIENKSSIKYIIYEYIAFMYRY